MRQLLVLSVFLCASLASPSEAVTQSNETSGSAAAAAGDTLLVRKLLTQGAAALRGQQWAEAIARFSAAYEHADGEQRSDANFLWAYALYTQGTSIARENLNDDSIETHRALEFLRETLARLTLHEHRSRAALTEAAVQEIRTQEKRLHRDP